MKTFWKTKAKTPDRIRTDNVRNLRERNNGKTKNREKNKKTELNSWNKN